MIISPRGEVIKQTYGPGEASIRGRVDLEFLRKERARPFWPTSLRAQIYADEYRDAPGWPKDAFADKPIEGPGDTRELLQKIIERRYETGVYVRPAKDTRKDLKNHWT